jgi:hypothetical protein
MRTAVAKSVLLLAGLLLSGLASGVELYRYVNDKGVVVINRLGVPPEFIAKGYEVLNEQGRVLQVVPPAPSMEERKRLVAEQARAKSDAQLRRLYSTPEDVERARERKLDELDGLISLSKGNLLSLRTQQANLQSQAADHERAGRPVPDQLLAKIDALKGEQQEQLLSIKRYNDAREQYRLAFDVDRDRLRELQQRQR